MAYCTQADILNQLPEEELIELTDDANAGVVDEDVVTRAIADADAEINGYCSRYSLPLSPVPDMIRKISVDLAVFNLYSRLQEPPDQVKTRRASGASFLKDVSRGTVSLGADAPAQTSDSGPKCTKSIDDRVFTVGNGTTTGSLDNY